MRIVYVPLDERPCNAKYPQLIVGNREDVTLLNASSAYLGNKKQPADVEKLWEEIFRIVEDGDVLVASLDMLVYGGLIPSRLHYLSEDDVEMRLNRLRELKEMYTIKILASNCIMRCPTYNSAEEEPDYYEFHGTALHRSAFLNDKKKRVGLEPDEIEELERYVIPEDVIKDYESRRVFNEDVNIEVLKLVDEGIIDALVIPQDDATPYGYTAMSQAKVIQEIKRLDLSDRVSIYPGADEVGCTLCGLALNHHLKRTPKIYPFYASTLGPLIVPLYEDRPMHETLKHHVLAIGAQLVEVPQDADVILAINSPGKTMQRAKEQISNQDITYNSFRNLREFVLRIQRFIEEGKPVMISDSAYGNGGDLELLSLLDKLQLIDQLTSISAWNTNANTLGTTLCAGMYSMGQSTPNYMHNVYRVLEDYLYQSKVRQELTDNILQDFGLEDYHFESKVEEIQKIVSKEILNMYRSMNLSRNYPVDSLDVRFPWHRAFEIDFNLVVEWDND